MREPEKISLLALLTRVSGRRAKASPTVTRMAKSKKNLSKAKLNLTVREEQWNKLEQMASLENRSNKFQIFRNFLPRFP